MVMNFLFNDCLPDTCSLADYSATLRKTLCAYRDLNRKHDCVVTAHHQDMQELAPAITLKQCILNIPDPTERTFAFRLFNKYPVGKTFDEEKNAQWLIENDFYLSINGLNKNATNLALAASCGGMAFTLGACEDLCKDTLHLNGNKDACDIDNLYGEKSNTEYIANRLLYLDECTKTLLEKLISTIGREVVIHDAFKEKFETLGLKEQESILEKFKHAAEYRMLYPIKADEKTIKDVTPANGRKGAMYELRIFSPIAIRVYFVQQEGKTKLIDLGGKNNQNADIRRAYSRL